MSFTAGFGQQVAQSVIRQAKKGDMAAFEVLYRTYSGACYSLAYRISGQSSVAQDVTQDVFIKVMCKISGLRNESGLGGWIRRITANETINRIRSTQRLHLLGDEEHYLDEADNLFDYEWLDVSKDLEKYISQLSVNARAVLLLHEIEGYSHNEIAALFGRSESFSKVTLSRALKALKAMVEETSGGERK